MNHIKLLFSLGSLVAVGCANLPTGNTVIPGKISITLSKPVNNNQSINAGDAFEFTIPEGMTYGVIGIFQAPIVSNENGIDVVKSIWARGNRSGLSGYSPGKVLCNTVYDVKADKSDLNVAGGYNPPNAGTEYWTVWGFDKYGNLLYSSESRTINW
jgi:hypothetical protein